MDGITEETVTAVTADPGILNVMLMGIGVVFAGLLLVMLVCRLILLAGSALQLGKKPEKNADEGSAAPADEGAFKPDGELAAVIGAAVAEELGKDVSAVRIISVKRVTK